MPTTEMNCANQYAMNVNESKFGHIFKTMITSQFIYEKCIFHTNHIIEREKSNSHMQLFSYKSISSLQTHGKHIHTTYLEIVYTNAKY